ncbi:signal peptidase I [Pelagirhabdus alkalitolerans]|uniref:Signal peptidase I n=1 Tax=Pelagirhabdus alkalitolerans TaxID=1612202 RepID=A0A1G6GYA8_9BACI|nr:signal peptidase I [Pelagirhabdus alkalitolerans]SDB87012.1 signal peptidase I [Pelagirhabdus alkalitolerans]
MLKSLRKAKISKTILLLTILFVLVSIRLFIFEPAQVVGHSMAPTIEDDQWILMNQLSFSKDKPNRGDVVVIDLSDQIYIKRVIALPNETIRIQDQQLFIDGLPYQQNFMTDDQRFWTHDIEQTHVPSEHYYVLGDNRKLSRDSRDSYTSLGFIHESDILGKAQMVIYPFNEWKFIY